MAASLATSGHGAPSGKAQRHVPERQDFVRALASGLNGSLSAGLRQTGRSGRRGRGRTAWFPGGARAAWPGLGLHGHPPALLQRDVAVRRGRRGLRLRVKVKVKTGTPRGARRDFLKDPRPLAAGSARPRRPPRPPRPTGVRERGAGPFPQPRSVSGLRTPLSGAAAAPGARGAPVASPCAAVSVSAGAGGSLLRPA